MTNSKKYQRSLILWSLVWASALVAASFLFQGKPAKYWVEPALLVAAIAHLLVEVGAAYPPRPARLQMAAKIISGFPLRRCSWYYMPIVPIANTRRMMRWLDVVCLKRAGPFLR